MDMFALGMLLFLLGLLLVVAFFLKKSQKKRTRESFEQENAEKGLTQTQRDLATLEHHVHKLEHEGYSKNAIMKKLTALGWHDDLIDLVL